MRNFDCSGLLGVMYKKAEGPQQSPQQQALYSAAAMAKPPGAPPLPKPVEGEDPASAALAQQEAEQAEQKMEIEKQKQEAAHRKEVADRDKTIADLRDKLQNANFEAQLARQQMELFKQRQAEIDKIKAEQEKLNTRRDSMAGEEAEHKSRLAEAVADAKANIAEERAKATEESANSNAQAYVKMTEDARKHSDELFSGIRDEIAGQKEELLKQREDFMSQKEHEAAERVKQMQESNKVSPYLMKSLQDAASSARNIAKLNSNMVAKSENLFASDLNKTAAVEQQQQQPPATQPQQQTATQPSRQTQFPQQQTQRQPAQPQQPRQRLYADPINRAYAKRGEEATMQQMANVSLSNSRYADEKGKAYYNNLGALRDATLNDSEHIIGIRRKLLEQSRKEYNDALARSRKAPAGSAERVAGMNADALKYLGIYGNMSQGYSGVLSRKAAEDSKSFFDHIVDGFALKATRDRLGRVDKAGRLAEIYGGKQGWFGADGFSNDAYRQAYDNMMDSTGYAQGRLMGYAKTIPALVSDASNYAVSLPGGMWAIPALIGTGMLDSYINPAEINYDTSYSTNGGLNPSAYNPAMEGMVGSAVASGAVQPGGYYKAAAANDSAGTAEEAAAPKRRGNRFTAQNVNNGYNYDTAEGFKTYLDDKNTYNGAIRVASGIILPMLGLPSGAAEYNPLSNGSINPIQSAMALRGISSAVQGDPGPNPHYYRQTGNYAPFEEQRNWYMAKRNAQFGNMYGNNLHTMADSMNKIFPNFV